MERRKFFEWMTAAIGAGTGAILSVPILGYVIAPALRPSRRNRIKLLDDITSLKAGVPVAMDYVVERKDGWVVATDVRRAFVVAEASDQITVFSSICTHAGCSVEWKGSHFLCPCHDGRFDARGNVTGGPPPRPLTRLGSRVEDRALYIEVEA